MNTMRCMGAGVVGSILLAAGVAGQTVSIKGSNTFGEDLGPALISEYQARNTGVVIELEKKGSGSGIAALLDNACDIAASSRVLNEDELRLAKSRSIRLQNHVVGYYGIALVVQSGHPVKALNDAQVKGIFTGKIANWKDIGGPDRPITLYIPDSSAGTYLGFRELAMGDEPYAENVTEMESYHAIAAAVAADPSGIGYVSLTVMRDPNLQGIIINGIHPSPIAVVEGLYPYARMVRLLTNRSGTTREARAFIRFVQSRDGQQIVEKVGFVPSMAHAMDLGGLGP